MTAATMSGETMQFLVPVQHLGGANDGGTEAVRGDLLRLDAAFLWA